jgi:hypothetical protein
MEFGDESVRIVTEVDDIGKARELRKVNHDGETRTFLLDSVGHRRRWDFGIQNQ